jgi:hypothetical protein
MKETNTSGQDEKLSKLLSTWKVDAQLPPRFQEAVWQRIKRAEATPKTPFWERLFAAIQAALARPAFATAYVGVFLFAGVGAGYWQAENRSAQVKLDLQARYVRTVDPYQMPR